MRRLLLLLVASDVAFGDPAPSDKKPPAALVLPGTARVVDFARVRPYMTPELGAEPTLEPSEAQRVEILGPEEALVLTRPYSSPLLGSVPIGTRLSVRGAVRRRGCGAHGWYAVEPFGYLCARGPRMTSQPATAEPLLKVPDGERLPFRYVMVGAKEGETLPMWASLDDAKGGAKPERQLEKGDTVAVVRTVMIDGERHYLSVEDKVLPQKGTFELKGGSEWHGEVLDGAATFPFGWVTPEAAKVYPEPSTKAKPVDSFGRRARVTVLEESGEGGRRMLRIGDGRWLRAADLNEVRRIARPEGMTSAAQWIDVDLGEQVLVAYEGDKPVYATLVSSGRAIPTPRGNYPIWGKVATISMKSQPYEDKAYFVNKVPWVLFFQAHNALHGAYWHDRFGVTKSHGCVNLAPLDARHLFEWVTPVLPPGWSGYRFPDLLTAPTVHIRNSRMKRELIQERPIGPPDRELEAQKLEEAEERRAGPPAAPAGMQP